MWIEDIRVWLNDGVGEHEVRRRLQARVPDFSLSPEPGGVWNWLLGLSAIGVASGLFFLLARRAVARRVPEVDDFDEDQQWQDQLDDELLDAGL